MKWEIAEAREALRKAIEARSACERRMITAEQAKERGEALVREKRAALARSRKEAELAIHHLAGAIRSKASDSSVLAGEPPNQAESQLAQAQGALAILSREHAAHDRSHSGSDAKVRNAAGHLITIEAETIADEIIAYRNRAAELCNLLKGLSYVSQSPVDDFRPWPMTTKLTAALCWQEPQLPAHDNPIQNAIGTWSRYRDALASDSNAHIEGTLALTKKEAA